MTIPFVNSIITWFLKKRKHQMELFIMYPIDVQSELLMRLLQFATRAASSRRCRRKKTATTQYRVADRTICLCIFKCFHMSVHLVYCVHFVISLELELELELVSFFGGKFLVANSWLHIFGD